MSVQRSNDDDQVDDDGYHVDNDNDGQDEEQEQEKVDDGQEEDDHEEEEDQDQDEEDQYQDEEDDQDQDNEKKDDQDQDSDHAQGNDDDGDDDKTRRCQPNDALVSCNRPTADKATASLAEQGANSKQRNLDHAVSTAAFASATKWQKEEEEEEEEEENEEATLGTLKNKAAGEKKEKEERTEETPSRVAPPRYAVDPKCGPTYDWRLRHSPWENKTAPPQKRSPCGGGGDGVSYPRPNRRQPGHFAPLGNTAVAMRSRIDAGSASRDNGDNQNVSEDDDVACAARRQRPLCDSFSHTTATISTGQRRDRFAEHSHSSSDPPLSPKTPVRRIGSNKIIQMPARPVTLAPFTGRLVYPSFSPSPRSTGFSPSRDHEPSQTTLHPRGGGGGGGGERGGERGRGKSNEDVTLCLDEDDDGHQHGLIPMDAFRHLLSKDVNGNGLLSGNDHKNGGKCLHNSSLRNNDGHNTNRRDNNDEDGNHNRDTHHRLLHTRNDATKQAYRPFDDLLKSRHAGDAWTRSTFGTKSLWRPSRDTRDTRDTRDDFARPVEQEERKEDETKSNRLPLPIYFVRFLLALYMVAIMVGIQVCHLFRSRQARYFS